jgi:hypothetical protein
VRLGNDGPFQRQQRAIRDEEPTGIARTGVTATAIVVARAMSRVLSPGRMMLMTALVDRHFREARLEHRIRFVPSVDGDRGAAAGGGAMREI